MSYAAFDIIAASGQFPARCSVARTRSGSAGLAICWTILLSVARPAVAQNALHPDPAVTLPPPSVSEKWNHFTSETFGPFTLTAGAFNATLSQVIQSAPSYGRDPWPTAYPKRLGASLGDIVSQNFFGDFLLASALHQDTRYVRLGPSHRLWPRIGYAISRAVITRNDSGGTAFNSSNVLGTAMSAGLSNAYYPPASRTARVAAVNWGTSVADSGLANLLPELLPDVWNWFKRHRP